jgi:ketosteroid isomerase-like protein
MDTTTTQNATATTTDQVPAAVRSFTDAHAARDADAALALLAPGAVISDVGEPFTGDEALRHFVRDAGAEFTYTDDVTGIVG